MTYEILGTFAAGLASGLGVAYAYWKTIPKAKKKAAFKELRKGLSDRKLSIDEVMVAAEQLF